MKHLIFALLSVNLVFSEIIYEQGSLTEFIAGNSPETSYENWLSHVTEGVASPGFNDYGPEWLDIQTNGFGNHRVLTENSPTLHYWETIFNYFVAGDTTYVDSLLQDSIQSFFYASSCSLNFFILFLTCDITSKLDRISSYANLL